MTDNRQPRASHGFDRRVVLQSMLAAAIAPAALSSIRTAGAQDAAGLLKQSATAMAAVKSFVFSITTVQGKTQLFGNLELKDVEGAVQRPDRFKADITVGASIVTLTVKVIGIGSQVWVTNPMSSNDAYVEASSGKGDSSADTIATLLNPDRIFIAAVEAIQNPTIDGTEKVDDVDTTKVKGTVDLSNLPVVSAVASPTADKGGSIANFIDLSPKTITAWIDATGLVHRIQVEGAFTKDESSDVIREIDLTKFNDPQDVQPPTPVAQ
jgi:lipoprotein LprA